MIQKLFGIYSKITTLIIGILFLAGGLAAFFCFDPAAYDMEGTGKIVEIEEYLDPSSVGDDDLNNNMAYNVYIDYTAGGQTFEHAEYIEYNSNMKVGDTVHFYYQSADPSKIAGSDKNLGPYIGLGFAAVGLLLLGFSVFKFIRKAA